MSFKNPLIVAPLILALSLCACGGGSSSSSSSSGGVNNNNQSLADKTRALGKKLFFDEDLSSHNNQSCGSCHDPLKGFADPNVTAAAPVSAGSPPATFGNRNAPTAAYAAFIPPFTQVITTTVDGTSSNFQGGQFLDGRASTLVDQAKAPFLNPLEMNNADKAAVVSKVQSASYADDFTEVFGAGAFSNIDQTYDNIAAAIAAFETSAEVNPFTSKFDAVMAGSAIFSASELRGFNLFKGTVAKCANCHTVNTPANGSQFTDFNYYNIATPINTSNPAYIANNGFRDIGLGGNIILSAAQQAAQQGKFRTPTLRNVELTAPYMHNGIYATLTEVIRHYDITATDSAPISFTTEVINDIALELNFQLDMPLGLSMQDYADLEAFMLTLTDGFM